MSAKDELWKRELNTSNAIFRELINSNLADGIRREEIMRQESEKRENIIRLEAEKREQMLMRTVDGLGATMEKISDSMNEMSKVMVQIDFRLTNIEKNQ
jgi:hypothetical protein